MAHTPGPWIFREQGAANEYCILTPDKRWLIAFLQNGELHTPEQRDNVRLMVAAPELLEAVLYLYPRVHRHLADATKLKAIAALAENLA